MSPSKVIEEVKGSEETRYLQSLRGEWTQRQKYCELNGQM